MCHHFFLKANALHLKEYLQAQNSLDCSFPDVGFFPLAEVPILRCNQQGERELISSQWGLLPFWWKSSPRHKTRKAFQRMTFNARSETIDEKPTYREAFKSRRCIIPASQFVEKGELFEVASQPLMLLAGLWEQWSFENEQINSCTILTTNANPLVARYHPRKRMPVILPDERAVETWLSPDIVSRAPLEHLFLPFPENEMTHHPIAQ
ncbi:MAG: SOS response-associated peptidase [Planctomycetaceae bacterium]|nr:SOS response-associated peptidase [Planctomycetaceae bacterium]